MPQIVVYFCGRVKACLRTFFEKAVHIASTTGHQMEIRPPDKEPAAFHPSSNRAFLNVVSTSNSLRQTFLFKHSSQQIVLWIGEVVQSLKKAECHQNRTVIPMETPGSPFSSFDSVALLIPALSATSAVGSLLRFLASLMSCPSLRIARWTGIGLFRSRVRVITQYPLRILYCTVKILL